MKSVRVKNYRSIIDSGEIEIKPLTVLVGKNSAGKSSFIRLFPLLKQTIEKNVDESLLWYGDYVDFGDFNTTIAKNHKKNDEIEMSFYFDFYDKYLGDLKLIGSDKSQPIKAILSLKINETHINEYKIVIEDQEIIMNIDTNHSFKLTINGESFSLSDDSFTRRLAGDIIPTIAIHSSKGRGVIRLFDAFGEIMNKVSLELYGKESKKNRINTFELMFNNNYSKKDILEYIKKVNKEKFKNYKVTDKDFEKINNLCICCSLPGLIDTLNNAFKNEIKSLSYLKPIRAAVNRYYRVQGISVNEVDSDGSNLPMILKNMSKNQLTEFEEWSKEKFGVIFSIDDNVTHLSLIIRNDVNSKEFTNVADAGYGYSQMLPIVVLLWNIHNKKKADKDFDYSTERTIIIEQPELHLHPAFQAKMIDVFVNIINECRKNNISLKIIFETHSETMINRIGHLIYKNKLSEKDVNILIFDKNNNETKIYPTSFDSDGLFEKWPIDFLGIED